MLLPFKKKISLTNELFTKRTTSNEINSEKLSHRSKDAKVYEGGPRRGQTSGYQQSLPGLLLFDRVRWPGNCGIHSISESPRQLPLRPSIRSFSPRSYPGNCAYSPVARQPSCHVGSTGIPGPPRLSSGAGSWIRFGPVLIGAHVFVSINGVLGFE